MKPALRFALRLAVGAALLTFILRRVSWEGFGAVEPRRLATGVAAGFLFLLAGQSIAALRWKILLGEGSPRWSYLSRLYFIGSFFSLFLPTAVGGDAVRAVAAAQSTSRAGAAVASVVLDRLFGVAAMLAYLVLGLLLAPGVALGMAGDARWRLPGGVAGLAAGGIALLLLGGLAFRWSAKLRAVVLEGWAAITSVARSPSRALQALGLGFVVQGIYISLWVALAAVMRFELPFTVFLIAVPLVTLGTMLPVSIAGLGLREGAWLLLLRNAGIADGQIVAYSLLYFGGNLLVGMFGGGLLVLLGTGTVAREG